MNRLDDVSQGFQTFHNFEEAANRILKMMQMFIDINTLFIAKNDSLTNHIVDVINQDERLLSRGDELPFDETFCKLSVDCGNDVLIIKDINKDERSCRLSVTENLGEGCFIGIPIYYENGDNYGTICGLDQKPFDFNEKHVELFKTMSQVLSYVLELDKANRQIQHLSAPIVPVTHGVAVLPIIGEMYVERVEAIIALALSKSQELDLTYLIIDLSGISQINARVSESLLKIVTLLKLMGVKPLLTGIQPEMAINAVKGNVDLEDIIIEANLEKALSRLGFQFVRNGI
ncbi:STAS domain-containing protein [Bacillus sp. 1P06AnD]|uniref:STAS domain-containing protein n=1 Tax=Bacillus sp. 1P06AnD TaxID=3132208 RepID=UPI0039A19CB6